MSEKDTARPEETPKKDKTIDLSEWQKKNQAYLERRAEEKRQKEAEEAQKREESRAKIEELRQAAAKLEEQARKLEPPSSPASEEDEQTVQQPGGEGEDETEEPAAADASASEDADSPAEPDEEQEAAAAEESAREEPAAKAAAAKKAGKKAGTKDLLPVESRPPKPKTDWKLLLKASPVVGGAVLFLLLSLYFMSPWSRLKTVTVTGNAQMPAEEILAATGISEEDYTVTTFFNQARYAENVKKSLVWIASADFSYQFPTAFTLEVSEHRVVGYVKDDGDYYPILSNGEVIDKPVTSSEVPDPTTIFQLSDLEMVKAFVVGLEELDPALMGRIETVKLSPTAASADLLSLSMRDGHTVLVPLSGLTEKLGYYSDIAASLTVSSVIDMEAGIYSYAK